MAESYVRKGKRLRKFLTAGSRFGPGKVHLEILASNPRPEINAGPMRAYIPMCQASKEFERYAHFGFGGFHGAEVAKGTDLTCKRCIKLQNELGLG